MRQLLTLGSRLTFVGGKGGVGKTTVAAALAVSLADEGERVLALSVDPAHSLGDALDVELGAEEREVPGVPGLSALEVDADTERQRFLSSHRGTLLELILRGTYLDRSDVDGFLDLAVPGMDELAALIRLLDLLEDPDRRVVVDTAPTGHTLRLLELPRVARQWLGALEAMEEKHQAVAAALVGAVPADEVTRLLGSLDEDLRRLSALLCDRDATRFLLVTTPEPVVLAETLRYQDRLAGMGVALAGILVNRSSPAASPESRGPGMIFVPRLPADPRGPGALRDFAAAASATPSAPPPAGAGEGGGIRVGEPYRPPLDRFLYLVGGKGGVGKSTAASALAALLAAEREGPILLLSTDPAGSLGDVLRLPVGRKPVAVPGAPGLLVQQVDAGAAWDDFRAQYREETERLFSGLLGGGLSAQADRRVVERLVDLAPPGLDELVALLEVIDFIEDQAYNALVVDTAPTGHLLRLLEMPAVALEWSHSVLRLLLKYREVAGLGSLAERVLELARSLRALRSLLTDPQRTWFLAVALPEALSVPETRRLIPRLRSLGIEPGAVLVNRLLSPNGGVAAGETAARELLELEPGLDYLGAPAREKGPAEVPELLRFVREWRRIRA